MKLHSTRNSFLGCVCRDFDRCWWQRLQGRMSGLKRQVVGRKEHPKASELELFDAERAWRDDEYLAEDKRRRRERRRTGNWEVRYNASGWAAAEARSAVQDKRTSRVEAGLPMFRAGMEALRAASSPKIVGRGRRRARRRDRLGTTEIRTRRRIRDFPVAGSRRHRHRHQRQRGDHHVEGGVVDEMRQVRRLMG